MSKTWVDVRDIFVAKTQITSPVEVVVPVADEIDTHLVYPNPKANQVPALDGILAYIAQQKLGGAAGVTNKYFSVRRKNYSIFEGDSYITKKAVSMSASGVPFTRTSSPRPSFKNEFSTRRSSGRPISWRVYKI